MVLNKNQFRDLDFVRNIQSENQKYHKQNLPLNKLDTTSCLF